MSTVYEFGPFVLAPADRALRRDGRLVRIPPKTFDLLLLFVEHPDQLLTKETLFAEVWKGANVVEANLPFQIRRLRRTLGDGEQETEEYIQTVTGFGYRFVTSVRAREEPREQQKPQEQRKRQEQQDAEGLIEPVAIAPVATAPSGPPSVNRRAPWLPIAIGIPLLLTMGVVLVAFVTKPTVPRVVGYTPLTLAMGEMSMNWMWADSTRVYFTLAHHDSHNPPQLMAVAAHTSGTAAAESMWGPTPRFWVRDVSPKRSEALAVARPCDAEFVCEMWTVPLIGGGSPRRLDGLAGTWMRWSPDERRIAYARVNELYVAAYDGTQARKILTMPSEPGHITWSPDGTRLRFAVRQYIDGTNASALWEVGADGRDAHPLLPGWNTPPQESFGNWSPDGRYYVFSSTRDGRTDLWALPEARGPFSRGASEPVQLTKGPIDFRSPVFSADGSGLFAWGHEWRGELVRYDRALETFISYLDGISASQVRFAPDGAWVSYISHPDNVLWWMRPDGTGKTQLTFPPFEVDGHAWAPDGKTVALHGRKPGDSWHIYLLDVDKPTNLSAIAAHPRRLTTRDAEEGMPTWSADGTRLVFGDVPPLFGHAVGTEAIHVYDLAQRKLSDLPGSQGFWTARWSPDGREIAALTIAGQKLMIFDVATGAWRRTSAEHVNDPTWSNDGRDIYFDTEGSRHVLSRIRLASDTVEELANLRGYPTLAWGGLSPDNSPLLLRNVGRAKIYAIELDAR